MWYIAAFAGIVLMGAVAGTIHTRSSGNGTAPVSSDSFKRLSIEEINLLLARLESEEPPEVINGAMCYRVAGPPSVAEYTCPLCGEKTIYQDHRTELIEYQLETARRLAESVDSFTEFDVLLDESLFCSFCSQGSTDDARLVLRIISSDGEEVSNIVSLTDLRILISFLRGELCWLNEYDARIPLKDQSDRIRRLLGLPAE